jgi:microsomal dipeptidase-like Zn-dependent dipeptidase
VALGTDFDGTVQVPFDAAGLPHLTDALLEAGFSPGEIRQILGGNVVRTLRQALPRRSAAST